MLNHKKKHIHCIGIGGIGVSALAELFFARGYCVSGSDISDSANTKRLQQLGIDVAIGHRAENIHGADSIIYSSAIHHTNPEFMAAEQQKIALLSRGAALANFVNCYQSIAIAGTHGKTTTTSLVAHLLTSAGLDPSYVIGGILNNKSSPVQLGSSDYFVVEVDESDASFLYMQPVYSIVTNVDVDHLETYGGNFDNLQDSFLQFLSKIPAHGRAYLCIDDPVLRQLIPKINGQVVTYGFHEQAEIRALDYRQFGMVSEFNVFISKDNECIPIKLNIPGRHNAQNALSAIGLARSLGVSALVIQEALATFPGVGRRFHGHGEMKLAHGTATIIEDYGHHPREIKATLDAAKLVWPNRRIALVFQPHRYSRTRDLYAEFVQVLGEPDKLFLLDIYSAGELPIENMTSLRLLEAVAKATALPPTYVPSLSALPQILFDQLEDKDVVILQGAGNVGSVAKQLM